MPLPESAASFAAIQEEFERRIRRIVWAQVATIDSAGRPRVRVLHPVWEGNIAWITTAPDSLKLRHIARSPWALIGYWDAEQTTVTAECHVTVVEDAGEKSRVFQLLRSLPEPYGYDPSFWGGTPDLPAFALLRCEAWQVELAGYPKLWEWQSTRWTRSRPRAQAGAGDRSSG